MSQTENFDEADEQKSARIERILEAAYELFSTRGIEQVAMTDIAENSKIGVASLYRYFETKDEIAMSIIKRGRK